MLCDGLKQPIAQSMVLQQMAQLRTVVSRHLLQPDIGTMAYPHNPIEQGFGDWITDVIEEWDTMHAHNDSNG